MFYHTYIMGIFGDKVKKHKSPFPKIPVSSPIPPPYELLVVNLNLRKYF